MTIPTTELGCPQTRFPRKFTLDTKIRGGKEKNKKIYIFFRKRAVVKTAAKANAGRTNFRQLPFGRLTLLRHL